MKMNIVDAQNACLSGGVAVGAIADLSMQPYGAIVIGSAVGILSTVGYQLVQVRFWWNNLGPEYVENISSCSFKKKHLWAEKTETN